MIKSCENINSLEEQAHKREKVKNQTFSAFKKKKNIKTNETEEKEQEILKLIRRKVRRCQK
jgi:hypothetical protein